VVVPLVRLVAGMVFVNSARLVPTKIPKVKRNAVTRVPHREKYPTMKARAVNYHRGVPATHKNIWTTPTKMPRSGVAPHAPTVPSAAPVVLCHGGLLFDTKTITGPFQTGPTRLLL